MKITTALICTLWLVGFILVVAAVGLVQDTAFAQPPIPHPLEGRDNCLACHETGVAGAPQVPADHKGRTIEMCRMCHVLREAPAPSAPLIPHPLEGRENCTGCHQPQLDSDLQADPVATATFVPPPLPTPIVYPQGPASANTCADCHEMLGGDNGVVVTDWRRSAHANRGVTCANCHGGDPNAPEASAAMDVDAGFIGKPAREAIPALCASCHADVVFMRQYNLPTDQYSKYQESVHGQRLAQGDPKVATCFDCHDGHATHETNDPRADVYRLNVPLLCASCHADAAYMAEYETPTNQFEHYQASVHGVALLENQNVQAPNCATCHGTHSAAPPGFTEVANVCGNCHSATQDYFVSGPHNSDAPNAPRCITCHGDHEVMQPGDSMFLGTGDGSCGTCHDATSEAGAVVMSIYTALLTADESLADASSAVANASSLGMIVTEETRLLAEARTKLITARAGQHAVDLALVQEQTDAAAELSSRAQQEAEQAIDESRFRRQAMVIAVIAIGLVIASLAMLRRELTK